MGQYGEGELKKVSHLFCHLPMLLFLFLVPVLLFLEWFCHSAYSWLTT
jgi:hypothetical protein